MCTCDAGTHSVSPGVMQTDCHLASRLQMEPSGPIQSRSEVRKIIFEPFTPRMIVQAPHGVMCAGVIAVALEISIQFLAAVLVFVTQSNSHAGSGRCPAIAIGLDHCQRYTNVVSK